MRDKKLSAEPLVSAIVPTYNRANIVGRAIESILSQTYQRIEVLVIDDGSTDGTSDVLRRYDSRIRVLRQDNAGPAAARNLGIAASHGEFVAFLDSDDFWLPLKTERQAALLNRAGDSVPCCVCNATLQFTDRPSITSFRNARLHAAHQEGLWLNAPEVLAERFLLFNQTVMIRRVALERAGVFDANLRYLEDYDLALRLSLLGPLAFISEPLVIYNAGTAGSLAEEAQSKETALRENVVLIRQRINDMIELNNGQATLQKPLRLAVRRARRALWVSRLRQRGIPGAQLVSRLLDRAERYRGAVAAHSPWFEKMKTMQISTQLDSAEKA